MSEKVTHINRGIRTVLEKPSVYNLFQSIIGGPQHRERHYKKYFSLKAGARILDIGCGTGVLLDHLSSDIEYVGFDMEQSYINFAQNKFKDKGRFFQARVGENQHPEFQNYFDAININALLHHLSDLDSKSLLRSCKEYLKTDGYIITADPVYFEHQSKIAKWLISKDRGQNVRTDKEYTSLAKAIYPKVETVLLKSYLRIPYSLFVMKLSN